MALHRREVSPRVSGGSAPPSDKEKAAFHTEITDDLTAEDRTFLDNFTEEQRKKVLWKVCGSRNKCKYNANFDIV